jgi:hypothetical protein
MENQNNQENQINIELNEDVAEGHYSNLAIISHSASEIVIDFIRILQNVPKAKVKSRNILTPQHAKRLMNAIKDNLHKYESQFGKIEEYDMPALPMNFGGPTAQA